MMFLAVMPALEFGPGTESLDCRLYDEPDIPWDQLAFPTITHTLRYCFDDRRRGNYSLHFADIVREGGETILLARRDAAGPDAEP